MQEFSEDTPNELPLSATDVAVIERGLTSLAHYFKTLTPETFPQIIIFPDTTARPLWYAVRPLIKQQYTIHHLPLPQINFVPVFNNLPAITALQNQLKHLTSQKRTHDIDIQIHLIKTELEVAGVGALMRTSGRKFIDIDLVERTQRALARRLSDIIHTTNRLLVIDDFTDNGGTFSELITALDKISPRELDLTCFTFFNRSSKPPQFPPSIYGTCIAGSTPKNFPNYSGFSYRGYSAFNPYDNLNNRRDKASITGVSKHVGESVTRRSPFQSPRVMQQLRNLCATIGEHALKH